MGKRRPSGDRMVRNREDGRWEGRTVGGHNNKGEPIYKYVLAKTLTELTQKLYDKIKIYRGTDLSEDCNMLLNEWLVLIKKYIFHTVEVSIVFFSYSVRNRSAAFLYQAYPTRQQDR